jgi:hypothetical protein
MKQTKKIYARSNNFGLLVHLSVITSQTSDVGKELMYRAHRSVSPVCYSSCPKRIPRPQTVAAPRVMSLLLCDVNDSGSILSSL